MGNINFRYYNVQALVPVIIGLLLVLDLLFQGIGWVVNGLGTEFHFNAPGIIMLRVPTNGAIIMLFLKWYDKKLWKRKWLSWLVTVPNMNGRYKGELESSYQTNGSNTLLKCALEVSQMASSIGANLYMYNKNELKRTDSESILESLEATNDPNVYRLSFNHTNKGQLDQWGLKGHNGVTTLYYNITNRSFHGSYFNEPQRKTYGKITVLFDSDQLQHEY